MVRRSVNGSMETALNWRELADDAMIAIEPEVRRRWRAYWQEAIICANTLLASDDVKSLIHLVASPSWYYPCPPELAARAIWPSSEPSHFIESSSGAKH